MQSSDALDAPGDAVAGWRLVAGAQADEDTLRDLLFAWRAVRAVKSNAILLAASGASVGIGMGQVNRVDSCALAVSRAGDRAGGAVAASDAFFPFADGLQILLDAGVRAVVAGMGVSGFAAADNLTHLGAYVTALDESAEGDRGDKATLLEILGATVRLGAGSTATLPDDVDVLVTSPGWRPDAPLLAQAA